VHRPKLVGPMSSGGSPLTKHLFNIASLCARRSGQPDGLSFLAGSLCEFTIRWPSIGKTELLDSCAATIVAPDFAVFNLQPELGTGHVQIPKKASVPPGMNSCNRQTTGMTERTISFVRLKLDQCRAGIFMMNILACNFYSHKREIPCYTKTGHCVTPFVLQVTFAKELILQKAA